MGGNYLQGSGYNPNGVSNNWNINIQTPDEIRKEKSTEEAAGNTQAPSVSAEDLDALNNAAANISIALMNLNAKGAATVSGNPLTQMAEEVRINELIAKAEAYAAENPSVVANAEASMGSLTSAMDDMKTYMDEVFPELSESSKDAIALAGIDTMI